MVHEPGKDHFTIYQLKQDESLHYHRFVGLKQLTKENHVVEIDNYNKVYEAALDPKTTLDDLYYEFNMQHPKDFKGHSMSVSDVVVLCRNGEDRAYYVDTFGFTELPDFLKAMDEERKRAGVVAEYKPLAKVEEMEEQNYNMIDNVLNNLQKDPAQKKEEKEQTENTERGSIKERLATKKAEVAERNSKPSETKKNDKNRFMDMEN